MIGSGCVNWSVCGVVSGRVVKKGWMNGDDLDGGKYYEEVVDEDVWNVYVDRIEEGFCRVE